MDAIAPNRAELESARVSRYELVDMMHKDGFEDVITGECTAIDTWMGLKQMPQVHTCELSLLIGMSMVGQSTGSTKLPMWTSLDSSDRILSNTRVDKSERLGLCLSNTVQHRDCSEWRMFLMV